MTSLRRLAFALPVAIVLGAGATDPAAAQDTSLRSIDDGWTVVDPVDGSVDEAIGTVDLGSFTWNLAALPPEGRRLVLVRRVEEAVGPLAIGVGSVSYASYALRVNGLEIGRHGAPDGPAPLARPRVYRVPSDAAADSLTLSIEIVRPEWAGPAAAGGARVVQGVMIGRPAAVEATVDAALERGRLGGLPTLLFAAIALAAGLYHLVLHLARPQEVGYLWFGLGSIAFGANALAASVWAAWVHDRLDLLFRFADASGHLTAAFLMSFVWAVLDRPLGRAARLYRDSHLLLAALVVVLPMGFVLASSVPRLLWLLVLVFAAAGLLGREAIRGRADARVLVLGAVAVVVAQVGELLRVMGWPIPSNLPYVGFSLVLLSMAAALAIRFTSAYRELDLLRVGLESKVQERTRRLREMTEAAERANATKGDLLATLSHELREPLKSVAAFAHLLGERLSEAEEVTDRDRDFVRRIDRSGQAALGLVSDLLDLSRLELGRLQLEVAEVDLPGLLEEVRAAMMPEAKERGAELVVETASPLTPVHTDRARLRQVLVNLVGNALKFAPEGRVTLRVAARDGVPFAVEVVDTGIGIPEEILEQIRAGRGVHEEGDRRAKEGVGIGLRISRALCELLDLELEFESAVGVGTTARVVLPKTDGSPD